MTGEGVDLLLEALAELFHQEHVHRVVHLGPTDARLRAKLFNLGGVVSEVITDVGGWEMEIELTRTDFDRLLHQEKQLERCLIA